MTAIGTPLSAAATRVLLLGAGELGKEVVIELQRLGVETIAADRYPNAPAMQVAHRMHVVDMLDGSALRRVIETEKPDLVVPEIEAIATQTLVEMEKEGWRIIPTANAARQTMNREGIRRLAAETLGVATSPYRFAATEDEFLAAVEAIGTPCVVKPVMSSSGKGQSTVKVPSEAQRAWRAAREGARGTADKVIVEGFVDFDYEITLLTVQHAGGVTFCAPVGHRQEGGDYQESWQPQPMSEAALGECQRIAALVTAELGGYGLFGVEFFVKDEGVWFSEVSPRPHDTGMVTMISQDLSEFAPPRARHSRPRRAGRTPIRAIRVGGDPGPRRLGPGGVRQSRSRASGARHADPSVRQARGARRTAHGRGFGARRQHRRRARPCPQRRERRGDSSLKASPCRVCLPRAVAQASPARPAGAAARSLREMRPRPRRGAGSIVGR